MSFHSSAQVMSSRVLCLPPRYVQTAFYGSMKVMPSTMANNVKMSAHGMPSGSTRLPATMNASHVKMHSHGSLQVMSSASAALPATMHAKSWILDEKISLNGSCHLTHNGMENNIEHMFKITNPAAVAAALADFEHHWESGQPVGQPEIDRMMAKYATSAEKKSERQGRGSRSRSLSIVSERSLSRALDVDPE